MSKEIALKKYDIAKPEQVKTMAVVLKDYISKQGLSVDISGKKYAMVEGWQFAGFLTGIIPVVESVENLSTDSEVKWKCTVKLMKGEAQVGIGIALCSNKENKKRAFDEYAILSMAQTRAIGKAYRNMLGFVMKLSGFESTPAEEIKVEKEKEVESKKTSTYDVALNAINRSRTVANLISWLDKIAKSPKLTNEEKEKLSKLGGQKLNQLDK